MIGLAVLAVLIGYVALWSFVFMRARNRAEKIAAVVIALLIPFWDLPIGFYKYQSYCTTEGGLRIYERIGPQDKVYFDSIPSYSANELLKQGFKVVEILRTDGKGIAHHESENNKVVTRIVDRPESSILVSIRRNENLPWNIFRNVHVARRVNSDRVIAQYAEYSWHGGWLQRAVHPLFRASLDCSLGPRDPIVSALRRGT